MIEIKINDLGENGEGIGKLDNFTVFVHGAIIGDHVNAKIIKVKKQYAIAKVVDFITPSIYRIVPECNYLQCGGCQTQMIDYKGQLEYKKYLVDNTMKRIGGFENLLIHDVIGMDEPFAYRNKSQYPVRYVDGQIHIGFYKQRTHDVVDINHCLVQHPQVNRLMKTLITKLKETKISVYNEESHKGYLRHIVTRISFKTRDIMLIFVTNGHKDDLVIENLSKEIQSDYPEVKSIIQNINSDVGNRVMGFENRTILGEDKIIDYIKDLSFEISPLSFLQVNPIQTEKLYDTALSLLDITPEDTVMDLYCGIGTISLFLAKHAKKVIGVEIVDVAIEDAKRNALRNNITNTEFLVGKAEEVIPNLYKQGVTADMVVVDPPRKGLEPEVIETLLQMAPKSIVYVSCKVSTLARDLKLFSEKYTVEEVIPLDMFPHTTHVECVVMLERR